jgi:putative transposase
MKPAPKDPDRVKRWLAFLRNHREAISAMDFFTVPTITFGVLYCFYQSWSAAHPARWRHEAPTSGWIIQQLREAFPFQASHKYLILIAIRSLSSRWSQRWRPPACFPSKRHFGALTSAITQWYK